MSESLWYLTYVNPDLDAACFSVASIPLLADPDTVSDRTDFIRRWCTPSSLLRTHCPKSISSGIRALAHNMLPGRSLLLLLPFILIAHAVVEMDQNKIRARSCVQSSSNTTLDLL
jgi:hypothetical protein